MASAGVNLTIKNADGTDMKASAVPEAPYNPIER
jgi:hypothetical protein